MAKKNETAKKTPTIKDLDAQAIFKNRDKLSRLEKGIGQYASIMREPIDPSSEEFQRVFSSFYRVRRNEKWKSDFFAFFARVSRDRDSLPSFEEILKEVFDKTQRVEASFCSKMLATIDPTKPIWDRLVCEFIFGHRITLTGTPETKIGRAVEWYQKITDWYDRNLPKANDVIRKFDQKFADSQEFSDWTKISTTKKIDFLIWSR